MPAWSQANGGPLSEEEIENLVAFILSWSTPANPPSVTPPVAQPAETPGINWELWVGLVLVILILAAVLIFAARSQRK